MLTASDMCVAKLYTIFTVQIKFDIMSYIETHFYSEQTEQLSVKSDNFLPCCCNPSPVQHQHIDYHSNMQKKTMASVFQVKSEQGVWKSLKPLELLCNSDLQSNVRSLVVC